MSNSFKCHFKKGNILTRFRGHSDTTHPGFTGTLSEDPIPHSDSYILNFVCGASGHYWNPNWCSEWKVVQSAAPAKREITTGLWYLKTNYYPYYTVVSVLEEQLDPKHLGEKIVFCIDEEGCHEIEAYGEENFICPVPAPQPL